MKNETRADKKFHRVLREYYRNELRSSSGEPIKNRERAIAIAFSEARRIDPRYHITKHANGTKIKIDNTLQIVFEDAWQHYLNYIASGEQNTKPLSFEQWLRTTNEGLKYNKRMAQLIRYNEIIVEPQMNSRGSKIVGASHDDGGVRGHIRETHEPIEVEGGELIITKNVGKIKQHITCHGEPEGIASRINELSGGDKISNAPATCHLKTEIMERGKKIFKKEYVDDDESNVYVLPYKFSTIQELIDISNSNEKLDEFLRGEVNSGSVIEDERGAKFVINDIWDYLPDKKIKMEHGTKIKSLILFFQLMSLLFC